MNDVLLKELIEIFEFDGVVENSIEGVFRLLNQVAEKNKAYLIVKLDGERSSKKFTVIFNSATSPSSIIRKDGDSLDECMNHLLGELINLKREGAIL